MKKAALVLFSLLVILFIIFWQLMLPIPTGYAAKNLCSSLFVAEMDEEFVKANDLNISLISMTTSTVDYENKSVRSTFLGLKPHVAVFRNKTCGCTLLGGDKNLDPVSKITLRQPIQNDTVNWPYGLKENTISNLVLNNGIDEILDEEFSHIETGTRAIVIVYNGEIIGERYAPPFDKSRPFLGWSMTKSITSTLVGILVQKGFLQIEDPVPIEQWQKDDRKDITWENLLQMKSGLEWSENYYWISDVTKMLYTKGDAYNCSIEAEFEGAPATSWEYSSGTTNIISGLIRKTIGNDVKYHNFPYTELFDPLHAQSFVMELDAAGNFIGSSYSYATARDWAKFGILYLNNGNWNGKQILPEWWTEFVTTPATGSKGRYGGQFWLNESGELRDVPADLYFADGFHGQRVFILPSKNLVVVRLGLSKDEKTDFNQLLAGIITAIDTHGAQL
jgi:CubicO group peptidase (beta-lactamase class C family)